jgi:hypothetical protein
MSLPMERWSISADEETKAADRLMAEQLSPFAKARSERIRFLYRMWSASFGKSVTPATVMAFIDAWQRINGITCSYAIQFPVTPVNPTGEERGPESSVTGPLRLSVSRPFRAAWVQEADTVASWPTFLRETHAMGSVA